jgi:hypothetical protein
MGTRNKLNLMPAFNKLTYNPGSEQEEELENKTK